MALLALAALLGVHAEDTACLLQSHKAQAERTVTCSHGYETYDFSTWTAKLYSLDEGPPEGGISITNFRERNCKQPGILNSQNAGDADDDILQCNCNALVMAGTDSTDGSIDDCSPDPDDNAPWIDLTFTDPQTILAVEFFSIEVGTGTYNVKYWVTDGTSKTATATAQGAGQSSPLELSGLTNPAPIDIQRMRLLSGIVILQP